MITTPIFTRILTTVEYGQYSVFNSWMAILTPIITLNLHCGVYAQGVVKFEEDRKRYSSSLQGLAFVLVIIWTVIYLLSASVWNKLFSLTTMQMAAMFIMIWLSASYGFWSVEQRVDFKYQKQVVITVLVSILSPTVSILFVLHSDDKVTARILGVTLVNLMIYSGTFIVQMVRGRQFFSKHYWLYALRFNIPLLPHYLSMTVLSASDRIMISYMIGDSEAGLYNLAYSISLIMTMFNNALLQTIEPWIYRKLKEKRIEDIAYIAYPSFILIAAVNCMLILFAPEIIAIFAPAEYQEAVWCIPAVALSVFFMFLYSFFATFEFYYEKTKYIASATVGGAVLNLILNYIAIRKFGYIAASYTTLLSYILFAILHYIFMRKVCRQYLNDVKPYELKAILAIGAGSLITGFGFMATYINEMVRYTLILLVVIIVFIKRRLIVDTVVVLINVKRQKETGKES